MTVTSTDTKTGPYTGNGATTVFPFTFDVVAGDDVAVVVDGIRLNTGAYSIDLANRAAILTEPLATGSVLYVVSEPSFEQQIQFENGSRWLAGPVNEANDRSAVRDIWLRDRVLRAPQLPFIPTDAQGLFPTVDAQGRWVFSPAGPGSAGPSNNTRLSLGALKAAATTDKTSLFDGDLWTWTPGNFTGLANDATIVQSDAVAISMGAWVRNTPIVTPQMFGAKGDGYEIQGVPYGTSDSAALDLYTAYLRAGGRGGFVPNATYRLTAPLNIYSTKDVAAWHALDLAGEQADKVIFLLDFDGPTGVTIQDGTGTYSSMEGATIGGFTVRVAQGRRIQQIIRVLNFINSKLRDVKVQCDYATMGAIDARGQIVCVRISAATQWSTFENILVRPFNVPPVDQATYRGTGIKIGNAYEDVPLQSSAISSNALRGCTVYNCAQGILTEAADATLVDKCIAVQNTVNFVDRASRNTEYLVPWDEGATGTAWVFEGATITDSTGTSYRKTSFPVINGGYLGTVKLDGVVGAYVRGACNILQVTANAEKCRAVLMGTDGLQVIGEDFDCIIDRFDPLRGKYVRTHGPRATIERASDGSEVEVSNPGNFGRTIRRPTGSGSNYAGFREETSSTGTTFWRFWSTGGIGGETQVLRMQASAARGLSLFPAASVTPESNGEMTVELTSNTALTFRVRGSDGVVRAAALTLA